MERVYSLGWDPRDPTGETRLGREPMRFRTADERYEDLVAAEPDADPERRDELRRFAERTSRQNVTFIDATFSAPKSVTVLGVAFERAEHEARNAGRHAEAEAWRVQRHALEQAVMEGARASTDYLQRHAGFSRVGHHGGGAGRWIDAHTFVVAQFLQHDSRDRDPQLHVHQAILNRVQGTDGQWRTIDGQALYGNRGGAGAIGERVMEGCLAEWLGVRFETRPDGKAREIVGVPQDVMDLFRPGGGL